MEVVNNNSIYVPVCRCVLAGTGGQTLSFGVKKPDFRSAVIFCPLNGPYVFDARLCVPFMTN